MPHPADHPLSSIQGVEPSLSSRETAAVIGVCLRTLWQMLERGDGPRGHRVGSKIKFRPAAIREWQSEREAAFAAERAA